jgi:hypothetical protein
MPAGGVDGWSRNTDRSRRAHRAQGTGRVSEADTEYGGHGILVMEGAARWWFGSTARVGHMRHAMVCPKQ